MMNVDELRAAFKGLRVKFDQPPESYTWDRHRYELARHVENDDPVHFLRWSTVEATMFVGSAKYIEIEIELLKKSSDAQRWQNAIEEPWFGDATPFPPYPRSSGNLIHQAYHLKQWESITGIRIDTLDSIFEFGGGYGAMALIARRLGFKGDYLIMDLPEVSLLQRYYLSNIGMNDIRLTTEIPKEKVDLFIGCFSLSEVSKNTRISLLNSMPSKSYLITYQDRFQNIDNHDFFSEYMNWRQDLAWQRWHIEHLPGRYYLIG